MKFSQPLVLLLGSVLSASGVGCSAISAIVTDSRPSHGESRSDTDRIAAIGRVFESQGSYDKAEVMYRKALKSRPQDPELRNQLQQLAERRKEQSFGPNGTATAISLADAISPPKSAVRPAPVATQNESKPAVQLSSPIRDNAAAIDDFDTLPQLPVTGTASSAETSSNVSNAAHTSAQVQKIELASGKSDGWRRSSGGAVTIDHVMTALESPDQQQDLLLDALVNGDSTETRALAATLLGDCDPGSQKVKQGLSEQLKSRSTPEEVLAICDSQVERGEADGQTVSRLTSLCSGSDHETQIQATSQLRNFAGTEFEAQCKTILIGLLANEEPSIRATAALTFGDFASLDATTNALLAELASKDASSSVREAAESALSRQRLDTLQITPASNIAPK